jgi:hypothetical protein
MRIIKGFLLLSLLLTGISGTWAQTAQIRGTVMEDGSDKPIQYALVSLSPGDYETATGPDGVFILTDIPSGTYTLEILANGYQKYSFEIVTKGENVDLNTLSPKKDGLPGISNSDDLAPVITTGDDEGAGASSGDNNISGILSASRDVYVSTASFNFGQARFRTRGYDPDNYGVLINGVPMNNLENGEVYWSRWGGLNDVFRFRDNSYGLELNTFSFGEIGGATNMDIIAARQRKQLSLSYAVGNRSYTHRLMATYSTGVLKNGWAVSASFSWRAAGEGYVPGTFYDSKAYYLGVSKKMGKHILSFSTFGTPTRRGKMAPAIQEVYDLADNPFYNPNWGYQNGKKRNSRVFESFQPVFMLNHEFKINNKSSLNSTASFQFGETSNSAIDWFYGQNPAPDYYRNLPSFQADSGLAASVREAISNDPSLIQLNWDNMYSANRNNYETVYNINGTTDSLSGNRSNYILGERVQAIKEFALNTTYNHTFTDHISLTGGLIYQMQITDNFNRVGDLLGGDYYVDLNRFAQIGLPLDSNLLQNDLDNPNRIVKQGDKYGTMYRFTQHKAQAWAQASFNFKKVDFFIAGRIAVSSYWRTGLTRVGLFPDNSLGDSEKMLFINPGVKAGITYKINGRHYVYANGGFSTRAPYVNNVFLSPRTRNSINDNLTSEKIVSGEAGYIWNSPRVRLKATGYYTLFLDGIETKSFFHDDYNAFVNMALSNLDRRHYGGEFGVEGKIYKGFAMNAVMGIGKSQYVDRPVLTLTQDNSAAVLLENQEVYLKNYYVASGPQWANTIGLSYNSPQAWFARLNFNWFDWIYVDVNPIRRTTAAVEGMDPNTGPEGQYHQTIDQERLPGQFTMDFFAGYAWKLDRTFKSIKRPMSLNFSLSVNNLTNNTKFRTSGFEQLRFDFDERNPNKFPPKYFYNFGINAFFNVAFRM